MKKGVLVSLAATAMSFNCAADYAISGFGTLALGKASGDAEIVDRDGVNGYDNDWSLEPGSFIGVQAIVDVYEDIGFTAQAIFEGVDDYDGDLTWAFLSYDVSDDWRVIAGRQLMPHYAFSDFIDVSYAYHWIEVPEQVYNAPFNSFKGISSQYTFHFDNSSLFTQVVLGQEDEEDSGKDYRDIWGGRLAYKYDWLTVNLGYFQFEESSTQTRPLRNGEGVEELFSQGVLKSYDIGVQVDYNDWYAIAEVTTVNLKDLRDGDQGQGTKQPWMVSVAKRIGSVTPHVTFGRDRELDFFGEDSSTPFYSAGVRWDFHDAMALKAEYAHQESNDDNDAQAFQLAFVGMF
ncbi:porin [Thalassotalea montiporae]